MAAERPVSKSRLSRIIAYRVARLHLESVKLLGRLCEANGFTFNVWKVFSAVGSFEPISAAEVCRLTTIDKAMVSRVIRQLVDRKLVERRLGARDARLVEIQLTSAGRAAYEKTARAIDALQKELLAGVKRGKVDEFIAMLQLLEDRTRLARDAAAASVSEGNAAHGKSRPRNRKKHPHGKRDKGRSFQDEAQSRRP